MRHFSRLQLFADRSRRSNIEHILYRSSLASTTISLFGKQYQTCNIRVQNRCASGMRRWFSIDTSVSKAFDRDLKKKQRDNAARSRRAWRSAASSGTCDNDTIDYSYFHACICSPVSVRASRHSSYQCFDGTVAPRCHQ